MSNLSKKLWRKDKDKCFSWFGHQWFVVDVNQWGYINSKEMMLLSNRC